MKKRWVASIALCFSVIGAVGASWYWLDFYGQFLHHTYLTQTESDIVTRVAVLEHIRSGQNDKATKVLEAMLDGDLVAATALARDGSTFSPNTRKAVAQEMKARSTSGYAPTDEYMSSAIQDAFRLIAAPSAEGAAQPIIPPDLSRQAAPGR